MTKERGTFNISETLLQQLLLKTRIFEFLTYFRCNRISHLFLFSLSLTSFISHPTVQDTLCLCGKFHLLLKFENLCLDFGRIFTDFEQILCDFNDILHLSDGIDSLLNSLFVILSSRIQKL